MEYGSLNQTCILSNPLNRNKYAQRTSECAGEKALSKYLKLFAGDHKHVRNIANKCGKASLEVEWATQIQSRNVAGKYVKWNVRL